MADNFWGNMGSTIVAAYLLSEYYKSQADGPQPQADDPDYGVKLQAEASMRARAPVVHGETYIGGNIFEQVMEGSVMYYALALSEKTGNTNLGAGAASQFTFKDIYWNQNRIVFKNDGVTADYMVDKSGKVDSSIKDLVKVYCYNGGSNNPVVPENYNAIAPRAYNVIPSWSSTATADELVFIIVEVHYNKDKGITEIGDVKVHLENSMHQPGDCMYDYMTNTRYGAGIDPTDILVS